MITGLGVQNEEQRQTFELRDEGEAGDFWGIRIENQIIIALHYHRQD